MLLGVWISAPLEIAFDNSERQSSNCSSNNIVLAQFHQIQHLWNATFEPRLTCKSVFFMQGKIVLISVWLQRLLQDSVMPFVRSLKHAFALEKFVFTSSTPSCVVFFSMCRLSAFEWPFWEVPVTCRFIESVLYNKLEELWPLLIIVRGQRLELVYMCASERW